MASQGQCLVLINLTINPVFVYFPCVFASELLMDNWVLWALTSSCRNHELGAVQGKDKAAPGRVVSKGSALRAPGRGRGHSSGVGPQYWKQIVGIQKKEPILRS